MLYVVFVVVSVVISFMLFLHYVPHSKNYITNFNVLNKYTVILTTNTLVAH